MIEEIGDMSPKAAAFLSALDALCKEHGVMLSVSDYDALQVRNHDPRDGEKYVNSCGIEDFTRVDQ